MGGLMDRDYFRIGMRVQVNLPKDYSSRDYPHFSPDSRNMNGLCGTIHDIDPQDNDACIHFPFSDTYHWYPLSCLYELPLAEVPSAPSAPPGVIFDGPFSF